MKKYQDLLEECEILIRAGHANLAAEKLRTISPKIVPRALRLPIANACRRCGLTSQGMKVLTPVVRPDRLQSQKRAMATPMELAEYAVLLQRYGGIAESLRILAALKSSDVGDVSLFRSYCYFNIWEYEKAIPCLLEYLTSKLSPYAELIGKVNLAAAYVETSRYAEAEQLLTETAAALHRTTYHRLEGNCFEMLAKVYIQTGKLDRAQTCIDSAADIFHSAKTHDQLFVKCAQAWLNAIKTQTPEPLISFRSEALERKEYETVREADLLTLSVQFDESKFNHLYFGTPYPSFRKRIESVLQRQPKVENHVYGRQGARSFDVSQGTLEGSLESIEGSKLHRFFEIVLRDFYRPMSVGALFGELFPDEHFNIFSSPHRIEQLIYRARNWLREINVPVKIYFGNGKVAIEIVGDFAFKVPKNRSSVELNALSFRRLRQELDASTQHGFSSAQASQIQRLSPSTFRRLAKWALEQGLLEKFGAGSRTRYFFTERAA